VSMTAEEALALVVQRLDRLANELHETTQALNRVHEDFSALKAKMPKEKEPDPLAKGAVAIMEHLIRKKR
jgi:hypothetical protein